MDVLGAGNAVADRAGVWGDATIGAIVAELRDMVSMWLGRLLRQRPLGRIDKPRPDRSAPLPLSRGRWSSVRAWKGEVRWRHRTIEPRLLRELARADTVTAAPLQAEDYRLVKRPHVRRRGYLMVELTIIGRPLLR